MDRRDRNFPSQALNPEILSTAFSTQTSWHVITGAPCSGKTTLIDLLATGGYKTVPEVGREYIEREIAAGRTLEEIRGNDTVLAPVFAKIQLESEGRLQRDDILFLDRAFPDCLGFFRLVGRDPNEILAQCFHYRYASVFLLDRLPYQKDDARNESDAASSFLDECLYADYTALGYDVIRVPVLPPQERLNFVIKKLPEVS
jgi:predicted ATPase